MTCFHAQQHCAFDPAQARPLDLSLDSHSPPRPPPSAYTFHRERDLVISGQGLPALRLLEETRPLYAHAMGIPLQRLCPLPVPLVPALSPARALIVGLPLLLPPTARVLFSCTCT